MNENKEKFKSFLEDYFVSEGFNIKKSQYKKQIFSDLTTSEFEEFLDTVSDSLNFMSPDIFHKTHPWSKEERFSFMDDVLSQSGSLMYLNDSGKLSKNLQRSSFKISLAIQSDVNKRFNQILENTLKDYLIESMSVYSKSPDVNNDFFPKEVIGSITDCSIDGSWIKTKVDHKSGGWEFSDIVTINKGDYYRSGDNDFQIKGFLQNEIFEKFILTEDNTGRLVKEPLKQDSELLKSIHKHKLMEIKAREQQALRTERKAGNTL